MKNCYNFAIPIKGKEKAKKNLKKILSIKKTVLILQSQN